MAIADAKSKLSVKISQADMLQYTDVVYDDIDNTALNGIDLHASQTDVHGIPTLVNTINEQMAALSGQVSGKVDSVDLTGKADVDGDTFTGTVVFQAPETAAVFSGAVNTNRTIHVKTGTAMRWTLQLADNAIESGSNAGSNLTISRYSDAGAFIDTPLEINRATGQTIVKSLRVVGGGTFTGEGLDIRLQVAEPTENLHIGTVWLNPEATPPTGGGGGGGPVELTATGGTITNYGQEQIHTFTSSGDFTVTNGSGTVQYIIVGGGGGAGNGNRSGGGGGGGVLIGTFAVSAGTYPVNVGAGGALGVNGGNSTLFGFTALGGGFSGVAGDYGGNPPKHGQPGASGGGGGATGNTGTANGGAGTQGYAGGNSVSNNGAGGGGGAGGLGQDMPGGNTGGAGGAGVSSSITGFTAFYGAGGGGGGRDTGGAAGSGFGGLGGGASVPGAAPTANSGGGGAGAFDTLGTAGAAGVVIIRYNPLPA